MQERNEPPSEPRLDAGLAAAFGPAGAETGSVHSVLEAVARITGRAPKVLLRDDSGPQAASPVIDASARKHLPLPAGRGNYQILGEIARGGMGTVMKGHDLDLGRDVAMKILHEKLASDPAILQRFVEEAQIGGQLQHPGIVPVYELGLMADDRPYFTMKLVKGRTLAALLKSRRSPDDDRHRFLSIFEQICQTLAYAHSKGVIHRDLKPANVMLGAFGEVQVVDWGLAKVISNRGSSDPQTPEGESQITVIETVRSTDTDGSASMAGSILGTPAYMPPEQASGDVKHLDERADVFALGGLLIEILTGRPPYPGHRQVALAMAAKADQALLLERLEACQAEAGLIELCRDCLAPDPALRPAHAGDVCERIRAQLASVERRAREAQVEAAEARVRAAEEVRRRRLAVTLAVALLALVLGGGGGWVYLDQQQAGAERRRVARQVRMEAQVERSRNEARVAAARREWPTAVASLERGLALALAGEAGESLAREVGVELEQVRAEARTAEARELLERKNHELLAALARVRQPWGTPDDERDYALEEATLGQTLWRFGVAPDTDDAHTAAAKIRERGPEMAVELAAVFEEWARVRGAGNIEGAGALLRMADLVDPDATRVALRGAIRRRDLRAIRAATEGGVEEFPIRTLALLGQALAWQRLALEEALEVYSTGLARHPESYALHMGMQRVLLWIEPPLYLEALRHLEAARALRPASPGVWAAMGDLLQDLGRYEEAVPVCRAALDRGADWPWVHLSLALALSAVGGFEESALESFRRAIQINPNYMKGHNNLGMFLAGMGRHGEALDSFRRAIQVSPGNPFARANLGSSLRALGREREAIDSYHRALELGPANAHAQSALAWLLTTARAVELRDPAEAVRLARQATVSKPKGRDHWGALGAALYRVGEGARAIPALEKACRLAAKQGRKGSPAHALFLAMALQRDGDPEPARGWYERALEWLEVATPQDPDHARLQAEAAALLGIEESDDE